MGKFLGFYFGKSEKKIKGRQGYINISESIFNDLQEKLQKDYKYIIETEDYKNNWGYGYKYTLEDSHLILLNKFKDEVDNDDSLIYFDDDSSFIQIQETYNIQGEKQYKSLEEISNEL
jgi:hypothetical protein